MCLFYTNCSHFLCNDRVQQVSQVSRGSRGQQGFQEGMEMMDHLDSQDSVGTRGLRYHMPAPSVYWGYIILDYYFYAALLMCYCTLAEKPGSVIDITE